MGWIEGGVSLCLCLKVKGECSFFFSSLLCFFLSERSSFVPSISRTQTGAFLRLGSNVPAKGDLHTKLCGRSLH